jgi:hypothetical protein
LNLRYKSATTDTAIKNGLTNRPVELNHNKALFNFILVRLDIGMYDMDKLLEHIQTRLNAVVVDQTSRKFGNVFKVSWVKQTGEVEITCNRKELEFHLKFYSRLTELQKVYNNSGTFQGYTNGIITDFAHDLWYMLGFSWPYEINKDSTDKYTQLSTNKVSFGAHSEFSHNRSSDDIFDRQQLQVTGALTIPDPLDSAGTLSYAKLADKDKILGDSRYTVVQTSRAYRYPSVDMRYIYLVIKGYKSIDHMNKHNSVVVEFTDHDFFAKVQLNASTGEIAYNTFVSNPLIFTNALDKIEYLDIRWVDDRGKLVDFSKVEHSFALEFIHYITQNDTNAYDTKLGVIDKKSYPDYLSGSSEVQYVNLGPTQSTEKEKSK